MYLQVLFPMKYNGFCLYFSVLDVDFISTQDDWYILADTDQVAMPVRDVFVRHSGCDVEHDNGTLSLNVVAVSESSKLLLTRRVPDVEANRPTVSVES